MRFLVTGGRDFHNPSVIFSAIQAFHEACPISVLGHGDALGVDRLAAEWALHFGVPVIAFPADWQRYGNLAGRVRNAQMLREFRPDMLMQFPGGTGTRHMASIATEAQIPITKITLPRDDMRSLA